MSEADRASGAGDDATHGAVAAGAGTPAAEPLGADASAGAADASQSPCDAPSVSASDASEAPAAAASEPLPAYGLSAGATPRVTPAHPPPLLPPQVAPPPAPTLRTLAVFGADVDTDRSSAAGADHGPPVVHEDQTAEARRQGLAAITVLQPAAQSARAGAAGASGGIASGGMASTPAVMPDGATGGAAKAGMRVIAAPSAGMIRIAPPVARVALAPRHEFRAPALEPRLPTPTIAVLPPSLPHPSHVVARPPRLTDVPVPPTFVVRQQSPAADVARDESRPATAVPSIRPFEHAPAHTPPTSAGRPSLGTLRPGEPRLATLEAHPQDASTVASPAPLSDARRSPEPILPRREASMDEASPPEAMSRTSSWSGWRALAGRIARLCLLALAAYMLVAVALIAMFRFVDPPTSALILLRQAMGETVTHRWVPIEAVSPNLARAVVLSEDGNFCRHHGIDFGELKAAIERARDGVPRGASTITMQVAKNLLLWPSKSYLRKAMELPLTLVIETMWSKRRILEVYLNIAEWGPGIFGAEAAARHHFNRPARRLTEAEAALLAVALPNPIDRDAGDPGPGTERLASRIEARMRSNPRAAACALS